MSRVTDSIPRTITLPRILLDFMWEMMLKHIRINFELLTDVDMVLFIERDIRGDLSCFNRYAQATISAVIRPIETVDILDIL